jgi:asparagine synthase (glutamine-hydrolysing)
MCGIAGTYCAPGDAPVELDVLEDMVAMIGHRGPDGHGLYRDDRVGLAHARLSIIDLAGGFQPLTNEDRTVWLTFNGEIFNYLELRRELQAKGHRFVTDGDSEVIVHLYEEHGEDAWSRLNGQFAFALWDRRHHRLWLVRDRLGILPLHYTRAGSTLVFASEAKALFASGLVQARLDPAGVVETFTRWSTAAPRTVFAGVESVQPGTAVCFDHEVRGREQRYWELRFTDDPLTSRLTVDDAADELGARLGEAVALRLRADVPVGAYLSGGLDSSVIASLVRSVDRSPLETFAVRFADPAFDETAEQRRMAEVLGTDHHEIVCGDREISDVIDDVVWHCESPLLRTAPAPLFLLSGLVRDSGMKVVLTGEGADELLAGYGIFKEDKVRRFWARDSSSEMRPSLLARIHSEVDGGSGRGTEMWQRFFGRHLNETDHALYSHLIRWENTAWSLRALAPSVRASVLPDALSASLERELPVEWASWSPLARAQWLEIKTFMSSYLLTCQGDRVAMAHGIEVRYPFLDPGVVDLCTRLPTRLKMPGLRDKLTLRRLASRSLPEEIWQRPKQPYRAPMTAPFFGDGAGQDRVDELLSKDACERFGVVDSTAAANLVAKARRQGGRMSGEREEMALVGILTLQMLARSLSDELPARVRERRASFARSELHVLEDTLTERIPVEAR